MRPTNLEETDKVCAMRDNREAGICTFSRNTEGADREEPVEGVLTDLRDLLLVGYESTWKVVISVRLNQGMSLFRIATISSERFRGLTPPTRLDQATIKQGTISIGLRLNEGA